MSVQEQQIKGFTKGVYNLLSDELIPKDALSDAMNWLTQDGKTLLSYGRQAVGGAGGAGKNYMEHTAYKANGTAVRFRKVDGTIQSNIPSINTTWTDVITGLTASADYVSSNYQSLAGAFVFFYGADGIYKIATANPTDYASLYVDGTNFKGFAFIDKGRSILWKNPKDPTGLYYSWVDNQRAVSGSTGVYTGVTGEATTSLSGTLAFKAGGARRSAFAVVITIIATGQVFTDDFNGVLTGSLGGTGTINYMTGAYTLSVSGVGTAAYQWEDSNLRGVTDFTYSATRLAGQGNFLRQDYNGTAIQTVIPIDGSYFSIKKDCAYQVRLDATDLAPVNEIFRTDIGISSLRAAAGTSQGIIFMNTSNPTKPGLMQLKRNPLGDNFDAVEIFAQFDFSKYTYEDCLLFPWDRYILIGCRENSINNNRLLLGNIVTATMDITSYGIRTATQTGGYLYGGDPVSKTTYELFTGFDDMGFALSNFFTTAGENYGSNVLKKVKHLRFKGKIDPAQAIEVQVGTDNGNYQVVGTILGTGDYIDQSSASTIGGNMLGLINIGGGNKVTIYEFYLDIRVKLAKFKKRNVRFVAKKLGYASIEQIHDFDIWTFQDKMPKKNRVKQNVSLDGSQTNIANPEF